MSVVIVAITAFAVAPAGAHGIETSLAETSRAAAWSDVLVTGLITAAAIGYALGAHRLALRTGRVVLRDAAACAGGLAVLAAALLGPLDAWAARSFAAHMVQHEVLMLAAAPLLVLARPLAHWTWAFPAGGRRGLRRVLDRWRALGVWRFCTSAVGACALQTIALFAWHLPAWFHAALYHPALHILQHATFLLAALCFWWSVLRPGPARLRAPAGIASLFVTTLTTGALGALLTFAAVPWFATVSTAPPLGLSALEDQQVGGLLMWIPGGTVYLVIALAMAARALRGAGSPAPGPVERSGTRSAALAARPASPTP
jgi:putative membrane protein